MPSKRSDETTSSDGTDELFEDAVDTIHQVANIVSPAQTQCAMERVPMTLKCPPLGPPPPLPVHLMSSANSPSPTSPVPPPLPPRKPLPNANNTVTTKTVNGLAPSSSFPPPLPPAQSSVSAPSVVISSSPPMPPTTSPNEDSTNNVNNNSGTNDTTNGAGNIGKELLHVTSEQSFSVFTSNSNTPVDSSSSIVATITAGTSTNAPRLTALDSKNVSSDQQQQSQFGRQRGHAKTNSLDRGLSLAKCMKTGPFPPPVVCSKSNSLTRGASPIETMPILDEQDQSASTVIQSVIQQVLSENNSLVDDNEENVGKEEKKQNGHILHHDQQEMNKGGHDDEQTDHGTSPPVSSAKVVVHYENLVDSSTAPPRPPQPCHGEQNASPIRHKFTANITTNNNNNGTNSKGFVCANSSSTSPKLVYSRSSQGEVLSIIAKKQPQKSLQLLDHKKFHRRSASDRSPTKLEKMPQSKAHKPTHQKSSTWEPHQAQHQHKLLLGGGEQQPNNRHLFDLMDPITRDVERRMSMKAKEADAKAAKSNSDVNNDSADDDDDVFGSHQHRHTGLDHVRRFARSYGVGAVDFLRGAVRKAKQIPVHLTRNVSMSRGSKKSEIIAGENEDGASSIADSDIDQLSIAAAASEPNAVTPAVATEPSTSAASIVRKWRFGSAEPPRDNTPSVSAPTTSAAATSSSQGQGGLNSSAASTSAPFARSGVCRPKNAKKGPFDFETLALVQEMNNEHTGAVWCVKFSGCGRLLATAGQDRNVRVWVLHSQLKNFAVLPDSASDVPSSAPPSPVPSSSASSSFTSSVAPSHADPLSTNNENHQQTVNGDANNAINNSSNQSSPSKHAPASAVFAPKPLCVFRGHTADVLDLSWSPRNYFLLSSGMDRTAKLWHLHRNECLCSFQHIDFVTCLAFLPKDDRYFISGSLDGKIRLWHIPDKKVAIWNEVEQVNKFITAMTFVKNGKFVVIGTFLGRCFFYSTDQLKYHTVIDVRSSRGKNSVGHKITSLAVHGDKLLVASDDSRIRIYDLRDMDLCCKFKGAQISQSLIRAAFSPDGSHVISGSEDAHIYLWRTGPLPSSLGVRKDRNHAWERIRAHQSAVITAVFAPKPQLILKGIADQQQQKLCSSPPAAPLPFQTPSSSSVAAAVVALPQHNSSVSNAAAGGGSSACASLMMLFPSISLPSASTSHQQHIAAEGTAAAGMSGSGRNANSRNLSAGDVVVSADLTGSLKVFVSQ